MHDIVKKAASPLWSPLTGREWQIAKMISEGLQSKIIAHSLGLAEYTIKQHLFNILRKLDFTNRTQVAVWVMEREIVYALGLVLSAEDRAPLLEALQQTGQDCKTLEKLLRQ